MVKEIENVADSHQSQFDQSKVTPKRSSLTSFTLDLGYAINLKIADSNQIGQRSSKDVRMLTQGLADIHLCEMNIIEHLCATDMTMKYIYEYIYKHLYLIFVFFPQKMYKAKCKFVHEFTKMYNFCMESEMSIPDRVLLKISRNRKYMQCIIIKWGAMTLMTIVKNIHFGLE